MSKGNKLNKRPSFISVDVWRPSFGEVSIKAIYEIYRLKSKCTQAEFKNTSLRSMVDFLRKLDNENYKPVTE